MLSSFHVYHPLIKHSNRIVDFSLQPRLEQGFHTGARRSSVVERPLMVRRVFGSIPHELFVVPASAPRIV